MIFHCGNVAPFRIDNEIAIFSFAEHNLAIWCVWFAIAFATNQCRTSWPENFQIQHTRHANVSQARHSAYTNIDFKIARICDVHSGIQVVIVMYINAIAQIPGRPCILRIFDE